MKVYREWRISGDTEWLRALWPKVKQSLDYCIETWDPGHKGWLEEPHHNTYDIEFWGPDGMCTSFYLGALAGRGRSWARRWATTSPLYAELLAKGMRKHGDRAVRRRVFHPEDRVEEPARQEPARGARAWSAATRPKRVALLEKEGPKYQYGTRLPVRRRARRLAGAGLRRRPGARPRRRSPATCGPSTSTT